MNPTDSTNTTTGSTFSPGDSSVYSSTRETVRHLSLDYHYDHHLLNMVLLLPPAPAARVLFGLADAALSARSAAAFLLIAVAGPPGGFGDVDWPVEAPVEAPVAELDDGGGEDYSRIGLVLSFKTAASAKTLGSLHRQSTCTESTYHYQWCYPGRIM
jgi:hypothetical protein